MAYDGYFKDTKTVSPTRPRGPIKYDPTRNPNQTPIKRTTRPGPSYKPSLPDIEPRYGTAVPTTPHPVVPGIRRSTQFLRWFGPAPFDTWGYASSFRYVLEPITGKGEGGFSKPPPGWKVCGQMKGEAIGLSNGPYYDILGPPSPCELLPLGGQGRIPASTPVNSVLFYETTFVTEGGEEYGTTWGMAYKELKWNKPSFQPPDWTPQKTSSRPIVRANPVNRPWKGLPQPIGGVSPLPDVPWSRATRKASAPSMTMGPVRSYGPDPTAPGIGEDPNQGKPVAPENPHKPPPRRTKERKGKVPKWFAALSKVAWEATEAVDVVDNLFECLPKKVQKKAPKTGVTLPDAWKPGIKYTSVIDRAKHVYNNVNELDLDCAMRKLTCNHIMDMLWGRFFGSVDAAAQKAGLKGFGRAAGSMDGLNITREQQKKFDDWISANPALDSLRKSLDCENLGRS